jgi:predicted transcriptional regulator
MEASTSRENGMRRLGDLEAAVMDRLWDSDRALSVREVLDDLNRDRALAYTTVMTVLDNLRRKGLVTREQSGRAYLYTPVRSREEHAADLIAGVLAESEDRTAPLLHFVQQMTPEEVATILAALQSAGRDAARKTGSQQRGNPSRSSRGSTSRSRSRDR